MRPRKYIAGVVLVVAAVGGAAVLHGANGLAHVSAFASILNAHPAHARPAALARQWRLPTSPPVLPMGPLPRSIVAAHTTTPSRTATTRWPIVPPRHGPGARPTRPDAAAIAAAPPAQQAPAPGPGACRYASDTSIYIPRLGVRAPVYDCDTAANGTLPIAHGTAVTHWYRSATLDGGGDLKNYVIYGHDDIEGSIFQHLPTMRVGDEVYLYQDGRGYVYTVTGSKIVAPTDTAVLYQTPTSTLTMISCYPYWVDSQRIVVRAALTRTGNA